MRSFCLSMLLCLSVAPFAAGDGPSAQEDSRKIQGTWTPVTAELLPPKFGRHRRPGALNLSAVLLGTRSVARSEWRDGEAKQHRQAERTHHLDSPKKGSRDLIALALR